MPIVRFKIVYFTAPKRSARTKTFAIESHARREFRKIISQTNVLEARLMDAKGDIITRWVNPT